MSRPIYYTDLKDAMKDAEDIARGTRGRKIVWLTSYGRYYITNNRGEIEYLVGTEDWMAVCWYENIGSQLKPHVIYQSCV